MVLKTGATLVRVKTMADNSIRIELDFGEQIKLGELDDLLGSSLSVIIANEDDSREVGLDTIIQRLEQQR